MLIKSDFLKRFLRIGLKVLCIVAVVCAAVLSSAQPSIKINEYTVGFPFDITAGPDGAMWFTNYSNIGRITADGSITKFPLPNNKTATRIAAGSDGALWFTESYPDAIGRITTAGVITEYPLPNPSGGVRGITAGPDGALWFTAWESGKIGRITTYGVITEYPLPGPASTDWITTGPDGAVWFTEANTGRAGVGRISMDGTITEYLLPPPVSNWSSGGATGIVRGPDGALWMTEWVGHRILRLTTSGSVATFDLPGCPMTKEAWICADGITAGPDGALWFTMFAANSIGRITTGGVISQYPIPTANSQSSGIAAGPDGSIWFTEHAGGKVGQIVLAADTTSPQITASATPNILWPPNGKMVPVVVRGTISDTGSGVLASSVIYAVVDEYQRVQPSGHIVLNSAGQYAFTILLQASRLGSDKDGRRYVIQVSATDNAGNRGVKSSSVIVPHH